MKEIALTQNRAALVDDVDADVVIAAGPWYPLFASKRTYAVCAGKGGYYYMHRFLLSAGEGTEVHHKNGNGLDNRRENLQLCESRREHMQEHHGWGEPSDEPRDMPLSVRLPKGLRPEIVAAAARAGITVNALIVAAIRAAIAKQQEKQP